jgi:hypothetical protein
MTAGIIQVLMMTFGLQDVGEDYIFNNSFN